jgi:hypothetical protein
MAIYIFFQEQAPQRGERVDDTPDEENVRDEAAPAATARGDHHPTQGQIGFTRETHLRHWKR